MDLKTRIDEMVAQRVEAALNDMLSDAALDQKVSDTNKLRKVAETVRAMPSRRSADATQPQTRRRIGQPRALRAYESNYTGRKAPALFPTAEKVFIAINKARKPITAKDLEKSTGLGRKTIESCVWYLRRHDADGNLVKAGKGLVIGVDVA